MAIFSIHSYSGKSPNNIVFPINSSRIATRSTLPGGSVSTEPSFSTQYNYKMVPYEEVYQPVSISDGGKRYGYGAQNVGILNNLAGISPGRPVIPTQCDPRAMPGEPGYFDPCLDPCRYCDPILGEGIDPFRPIIGGIIRNRSGDCISGGCDGNGQPLFCILPRSRLIYGDCYTDNSIGDPIPIHSDQCDYCIPRTPPLGYVPDNLTFDECVDLRIKEPSIRWEPKCNENEVCMPIEETYDDIDGSWNVSAIWCMPESFYHSCWTAITAIYGEDIGEQMIRRISYAPGCWIQNTDEDGTEWWERCDCCETRSEASDPNSCHCVYSEHPCSTPTPTPTPNATSTPTTTTTPTTTPTATSTPT